LKNIPKSPKLPLRARRMRRWESGRALASYTHYPGAQIMAKAQDSRKEEKKKPAQTPKEKKKAKQEKKKDKV
jgi:hypothetical protein